MGEKNDAILESEYLWLQQRCFHHQCDTFICSSKYYCDGLSAVAPLPTFITFSEVRPQDQTPPLVTTATEVTHMSVSGGGTSSLSNSLIYLQSTVAVKIKFPQQSEKIA